MIRRYVVYIYGSLFLTEGKRGSAWKRDDSSREIERKKKIFISDIRGFDKLISVRKSI